MIPCVAVTLAAFLPRLCVLQPGGCRGVLEEGGRQEREGENQSLGGHSEAKSSGADGKRKGPGRVGGHIKEAGGGNRIIEDGLGEGNSFCKPYFWVLFAPEFLVHLLIRLVRIDESRPGRKD